MLIIINNIFQRKYKQMAILLFIITPTTDDLYIKKLMISRCGKELSKLLYLIVSRIRYKMKSIGAHKLRLEAGRWDRTPRDERLCGCDTEVQTVEHIIYRCPLSEYKGIIWTQWMCS